MSVHGVHRGPDTQLLHDGCEECTARSQEADRGLGRLDRTNFLRAWRRAAQLHRHGLHDVSETEIPLLDMLWSVQLRLQDATGLAIGQLPQRED
jgi:hypothetical protein